jgi:hypothetical protein
MVSEGHFIFYLILSFFFTTLFTKSIHKDVHFRHLCMNSFVKTGAAAGEAQTLAKQAAAAGMAPYVALFPRIVHAFHNW